MTTSTSSEQTATVWPLAFAGALLVWLAQPPFAWHWLAWGSLAPWSLLAIRQHRLGRRGWWWLWLAAATSWLVSLQGIRLANPAIYPAWFALAGYLGIYPVLAVGLSRVIHHGWKIPVWIAFPSVWAGLELIRGYVITGFSGMLLGHTQADVPIVTQIADIGGTYYVSFVVAMASAVLASFLNVLTSRGTTSHAVTKKFSKPTILGAAAFATVLIATLVYGQFRLSQADRLAQAEPLLEALLIQRDEPLEFVLDPGKEAAVFGRYVESTLQAAARWPKADLIVWPESMFNGGFPYRILKDKFMVPEGTLHPDEPRELTNDEFANLIRIQGSIFEQRADEIRTMIAMQAGVTDAPELLVGGSVYEYGDRPRSYGAALHIDRASKVAAWYAKIHLVMFGEYIPFGSYFPWLYEIGPLRQGATPGSAPVSMEIAGVQIAPNICFETVVEHETGNSLRHLRRNGQDPQLIINLTNDAWFQGTAILTHHLRASQLVAIANRRPLLMTANQGPTTWIDSSGRQIETLAYQTNQVLVARPTADSRTSVYANYGDLPSWPFAILCFVAGIQHIWIVRRRKRTSKDLVAGST